MYSILANILQVICKVCAQKNNLPWLACYWYPIELLGAEVLVHLNIISSVSNRIIVIVLWCVSAMYLGSINIILLYQINRSIADTLYRDLTSRANTGFQEEGGGWNFSYFVLFKCFNCLGYWILVWLVAIGGREGLS